MKKKWICLFFLTLPVFMKAQHRGLYFGGNAAYQYTAITNTDDKELGGELDFKNTYKQAYGLDRKSVV